MLHLSKRRRQMFVSLVNHMYSFIFPVLLGLRMRPGNSSLYTRLFEDNDSTNFRINSSNSCLIKSNCSNLNLDWLEKKSCNPIDFGIVKKKKECMENPSTFSMLLCFGSVNKNKIFFPLSFTFFLFILFLFFSIKQYYREYIDIDLTTNPISKVVGICY